jgi:4-hydroxy-tetrahydrodipicolinate reductase
MAEPLRIIVAGATGWAGSALARGIARTDDLRLVAAVGRSQAGRNLREVLNEPRLDCLVHATADEALRTAADVFVEYTKPDTAKANILAALAAGCHVVVGTSGLADADYAEIAARYLDHFEVIDYAHETKVDAPSGTARELAARLGRIKAATLGVPLESVRGPREARGATLNGVQVHSVRTPGFVIGVEAIFGAHGQRLHIRHESGESAEPYVGGALLAIRRVHTLTGVQRGLDTVMKD